MRTTRFDERFTTRYFSPDDGDNSLRLRRLHRALPLAMDDLTARQREMVQLHFYENLSVSEIARRLEVNPSTVSRCLARAEGRLRRALRLTL